MDCSSDEKITEILQKAYSKHPNKIVDEVLKPTDIFDLYNRHRNVVISTIFKKTVIIFLAMTGIIANTRTCFDCSSKTRKALIKKGDGLCWICLATPVCAKKVRKSKNTNKCKLLLSGPEGLFSFLNGYLGLCGGKNW